MGISSSREREEGFSEKAREVLWPARYVKFTARKGVCLSVCLLRAPPG